ncbi:Hematopoietic prostaglandin D synthase [Holothuria leucospilota]|uniref:Hematopoietic prostaglandin D synthase n=1 Tax=Holothuria leucospilota TaxID=206669 RepID=A0A9Q0YTE7_HOLLE|nr:Hematopoietic prostaglandin D synthase [Holothuria leucospilota]
MSTYKITYFNARGVTETTRFIFAIAEQEYEDIRIEEADWPAMKEGPVTRRPVRNTGLNPSTSEWKVPENSTSTQPF